MKLSYHYALSIALTLSTGAILYFLININNVDIFRWVKISALLYVLIYITTIFFLSLFKPKLLNSSEEISILHLLTPWLILFVVTTGFILQSYDNSQNISNSKYLNYKKSKDLLLGNNVSSLEEKSAIKNLFDSIEKDGEITVGEMNIVNDESNKYDKQLSKYIRDIEQQKMKLEADRIKSEFPTTKEP